MELTQLVHDSSISGIVIAKNIDNQLFATKIGASGPAVPGATPPPLGTSPRPMASPTGNLNSYGDSGQQSGAIVGPNDYIMEDGEIRGMHDNFGKKTGVNIGKFESPSLIPKGDNYSLSDAISTGGVMLTEIAAGLAVGFLIWGAMKFATAAGDEENTAHAKQIMKWSIGGLILALIAFGMIEVATNAINNS